MLMVKDTWSVNDTSCCAQQRHPGLIPANADKSRRGSGISTWLQVMRKLLGNGMAIRTMAHGSLRQSLCLS